MTVGRTPKPADQRRNRHKPAAPEVSLPADARSSCPPPMPDGDWSAETVRWWRAWCETPASARFSSTEWERLFRALPLCAAYWHAVGDGDAREVRDAHAALLAAEKGLPATDYERRRNGIQIETPAAAGASPPQVTGVQRLKVV
jgi:hypothetical protein